MLMSKPRITILLLNVSLCVCLQCLFIFSVSIVQNILTTVHVQKRCSTDSGCILQKLHSSLCVVLYLATLLFVVKMLCRILYCSHLNRVSRVVIFLKTLSCSIIKPRRFSHVSMPFIFGTGAIRIGKPLEYCKYF